MFFKYVKYEYLNFRTVFLQYNINVSSISQVNTEHVFVDFLLLCNVCWNMFCYFLKVHVFFKMIYENQKLYTRLETKLKEVGYTRISSLRQE